jgi:hypothetical protein
MSRAFILVLDSVGVGSAPDAERYGDIGAVRAKERQKLRPIWAIDAPRWPAGHGKSGTVGNDCQTSTAHNYQAGYRAKADIPSIVDHSGSPALRMPSSYLARSWRRRSGAKS